MTPSSWLRKRPLNQAIECFHNSQQDQQYSRPEREQSSKPPRQTPHRAFIQPLPSVASSVSSSDFKIHNEHGSFNCSSPLKPKIPRPRNIFVKIQHGNDCNWNDHARRPSYHSKFIFNKTKQCLHLFSRFVEFICIACTCKPKLLVLFVVAITTSSYVYFVTLPIFIREQEWTQEWTRWEEERQQSVNDVIPPLPYYDANKSMHNDWGSNSDLLEQFPYLKQQVKHPHRSNGNRGGGWDESGASKYVVPIPDYELMGRTRGDLAQKLRGHAIQSCENYKQHPHKFDRGHSLPVLGITVATDTPGNRYLRRILHTIDLTTVGSIVITWYDERTEAQLVGKERVGLSQGVIEQALHEFITRRRFQKIRWDEGFAGNTTNLDETSSSATRLADTTSLKLMSQIASTIQQFCMFDSTKDLERKTCRNELLILRFSSNLGCSTGVNNPLFTHPTAPHWLIANYDVAYPAGVLARIARELQQTKMRKPHLAVHTYGYIYGRGKLENPWSNFAMTSCAVANVGVWDEDIFPAYFEDDDYRDRIRYIMGKWNDVIGDTISPRYWMNDTHLIYYQTERSVAVAHGPLTANTYLSGTHETLKEEVKRSVFQRLWNKPKPRNPFDYESQRWNILKEVSNPKGLFRCKHGALPDAGEHGEDSLRYFGRHERFILPFVNRTRVSRPRASSLKLDKSAGTHDGSMNPSPWALWSFNATRRRCVHEAANLIVSMPPSEERTNLMQHFKDLCSVC